MYTLPLSQTDGGPMSLHLFDLTGRTALVTGSSRGLGRAMAEGLARAGARIILNGANAERLEDAAAGMRDQGHDVLTQAFDVSDEAAILAAFQALDAQGIAVDILVNNAGITRDGFFHKMSHDQWSDVIRVNMDSVFNMTRQVINGMRDRGFGRIVNISSINGQKGQIGQTNYSAAKAGMIGFTKALALENARKGVTVNCIAPGYIDTEMVGAMDQKVLDAIVAQIPVGRLGKGEEIADMVSWLSGERAGYVTGCTLSLNGGQYLVG